MPPMEERFRPVDTQLQTVIWAHIMKKKKENQQTITPAGVTFSKVDRLFDQVFFSFLLHIQWAHKYKFL